MAGARYWLAALPLSRTRLRWRAHRGNRPGIMANNQHKQNKEERLAAKLRENLRRRKAQARALEENTADPAGDSPPAALPKDGPKS